ncbi:MAG: type II toxin-antitoxin system prevent-host-death family antitoxin [Actinomycetota bacterium]|nr:type II toxin-antitoxin system prevent-host-death family antitoxin [Actinomycetota bacterium]
MSNVLPLTTVKDRFSDLVDRVSREHDRVVVTRNGVPVVVLVSVDELESLEETLEVMSDSGAMAGIREAERELAEGGGEVMTEAEARARWVTP